MKKIYLGVLAFLALSSNVVIGQTTFNYTGAFQTYTVPAGITSVQIEAWGAQGGDSEECSNITQVDGGLGGYAVGNLAVSPGQTLFVYVGGKPGLVYGTGSAGGFNGGGASGQWAGAGGGASDVRIAGAQLSDRVIVAGGGGGGNTGCPNHGTGGVGGGLTGGDGIGLSGYMPGLGGTQVAGGAAGDPQASAGTLGVGGTGAYHVAGGGGGYYGGGGAYAAGGGGGSSYIGGVSGGTTTPGIQSGHGVVIITELCAPTMITPDQASLSDVVALCEVTDLTIPTATNDCGLNVDGVHNASLPITAVGTTVVTWTYDDGAGNITTQNQNVVISGLAMNVSQAGASLTVDEVGATYQWIDCDNGNAAIAGAVNQTYLATVDGSYAVVVNNGGCEDTSACYTVDFSGINELTGVELTLYPNPSNGQEVVIDFSGSVVNIELFDMVGRKIDAKIANKKIQTADLNSGEYLVKITTNSGVVNRNLIIQK